jgi:CRISPR-associated endonuclease/helicase Cas3
MRRILDEAAADELLTPPIMKKYFDYYFYSRADEMDYQLSVKQASRTDSLLNLLSDNPRNLTPMRQALLPELRQSFMTAGKAFKAIDAPTESVIVPYGEGKQLIVDLGDGESEFNIARYYTLLKKAQKFSVNVFPNVWQKLVDADAVHEIKAGEGVYCLDGRYYSEAFGLSTEIVSKADFLSL